MIDKVVNSPIEALIAKLLENRDALCAFLYMHLRNWHETEDLFQEISLVIMRKANAGLEIRHFKAWSREIARRTLLDYWKRKKKNPLPLSEADLQACVNAWRAGGLPSLPSHGHGPRHGRAGFRMSFFVQFLTCNFRCPPF